MPQGVIPFPFGDCRICHAKATGIHYGVSTCEGCKGFFKRSLLRDQHYVCFMGGTCQLTPQTRNRCKACRFTKCLQAGMSFDAVQMGRKPKIQKERALQTYSLRESQQTVEDSSQDHRDPDHSQELRLACMGSDVPEPDVTRPIAPASRRAGFLTEGSARDKHNGRGRRGLHQLTPQHELEACHVQQYSQEGAHFDALCNGPDQKTRGDIPQYIKNPQATQDDYQSPPNQHDHTHSHAQTGGLDTAARMLQRSACGFNELSVARSSLQVMIQRPAPSEEWHRKKLRFPEDIANDKQLSSTKIDWKADQPTRRNSHSKYRSNSWNFDDIDYNNGGSAWKRPNVKEENIETLTEIVKHIPTTESLMQTLPEKFKSNSACGKTLSAISETSDVPGPCQSMGFDLPSPVVQTDRPPLTCSPNHYSNAVIQELMVQIRDGTYTDYFDRAQGNQTKSDHSTEADAAGFPNNTHGNKQSTQPISNQWSSTSENLEGRVVYEQQKAIIEYGSHQRNSPYRTQTNPSIKLARSTESTASDVSPTNFEMIQSTRTRLEVMATGLEWAVDMMKEEISGRSQPHQLNRIVTARRNDAITFWKDLFKSIQNCSDNLIAFCNRVPGVSSLESTEKKFLLQRRFFEVWMLQNSDLFHEGDFYIRLPCGARYTKGWMNLFLPCDLVKDMVVFCNALQGNHTSRLLKKVLCALCLTEGTDQGFENPMKVQTLHDHYLDVLHSVITDEYNLSDKDMTARFFKLLSFLKSIAERMAGVVGRFNVDELPDSCLQYLDHSPYRV